MPALVFRSRRLVAEGRLGPGTLHVRGGVIAAVAGYDDIPGGSRVVDAGDAAILPGLVDTHVHVNDPGRVDWEGFETATRAAAAGGVTTIVDMPLNSIPPTTTVAALDAKRAAAAGRCWVDVGFWGGIVPGSLAEVAGLVAEGVFGFKAFLADSGVDEFPAVSISELAAAMAELARHNALAVVHAEEPACLRPPHGDPRRYATWLESRPDAAEVEAVAAVADLAKRFEARAHILHLSSADALKPLREARDAGVAITAETCPHYLALAAEDVPDGATAYKCAPPIRGAPNAEHLWEALGDGTVSAIVSDHSPCPPDLKRGGDFLAAWGGIASLQLGLPVAWTEAARRGRSLADVARWMSAGPAQLVGLDRKGVLAAGRDADLVIFDPDASLRVDAATLEHRHKITPYEGKRLRGVVRATYLRGAEVVLDGQPAGRFLAR